MIRNGKNWRIDWNKPETENPDFLPGDEYETAKEAEKAVRDIRGLYFLNCFVVRTTMDEDEKLPKRDAKKFKRQHKVKKYA